MNPQALSHQAKKILDILSDNKWHCGIDWSYSDGHTKRITDINRYLEQSGEMIKSAWCDCGRHNARVLKRRIVAKENVRFGSLSQKRELSPEELAHNQHLGRTLPLKEVVRLFKIY